VEVGVLALQSVQPVGLVGAGELGLCRLRQACIEVGVAATDRIVLAGCPQWLRARRTRTRLQATGPVANVLNVALFLALYLTPVYAPVLSVTSDAALLFYGASMLLAALRGYAGCEVLAVSNWLLGRDDQVGCLLFWPIDHAERRRTHTEMSASH
jgi:hypothetical protein